MYDENSGTALVGDFHVSYQHHSSHWSDVHVAATSTATHLNHYHPRHRNQSTKIMPHCTCTHNNKNMMRMSNTMTDGMRSATLDANNVSSSTVLYFRIVYHVLYTIDAVPRRPSLTQLKAQQEQVNRCFMTLNDDDLSRLPMAFTDHVGYTNVSGQTDLSNDTDIKFIGMETFTSFDGVADVMHYMQTEIGLTHDEVRIPGVVNVYVCSLSNSVLGQAFLGENVCTVDTQTIGSPTTPGTATNLSAYRFGKTLVHELGHCFGLLHTFSGDRDTCVRPRVIFDIPRQWLSNDIAFVNETSPGVYELQNENRGIDCEDGTKQGISPPYSCTYALSPEQFTCVGGPKEFAISFMDYASDVNMLCFSVGQSELMRRRLLYFNDDINLTDTSGGSVNTVNENTLSPNVSPKTTPSIPVIVGIVSGVVVVVIIAVTVGVVLAKKKL
jgi:predicted Zn-dependent protease